MKGAQAAKERPILFSRPMVAALARGEKTQTRRIAEFEPLYASPSPFSPGLKPTNHGREWVLGYDYATHTHPIRCHYGAVGDRLWVREPWRVEEDDGGVYVRYSNGDELGFPAHDDDLRAMLAKPNGARSRLARYMPRWASRFLLEIVNIRVERVQEISDSDALDEGWGAYRPVAGLDFNIDGEWWPGGPRRCFRLLWESIHGADAWERNDWVWVIEFRRLDVEGGEP